MGFLDGILGDPGGTKQTNNSTTVLTAQDQAAKDKIFGGATGAYDNAIATQNKQGFAGPKFVGPSTDTLGAQDMMRQLSGTQAQVTSGLPDAANFGLSGVLDVANNPALMALRDSTNQRMTDQFTQAGGPLSQIRSGAVAAGGFGGSRQGIAEGLAMKGLAQAQGDSNAQLNSDAYGKGLTTFSQTINSLPAILQSITQPAGTLANVGANTEGYAQGQENYDAAVRDFAVNKDFAPLMQMAQLLYGGMTPGSSSSGSASTSSSDMQDLGTVISLASLAGL